MAFISGCLLPPNQLQILWIAEDRHHDFEEPRRVIGMGNALTDHAASALHVVVVDDEPDMLDLLGELIRTGVPDARVTLTDSPFEALEHVGKDRVDLVVTDYRMPGLDGMQLAKQIRGQHPRIPIVLMTAFADDHLRTDAFVSRVNVFLKKPVDPAELLSEVRRLLQPQPSQSSTPVH